VSRIGSALARRKALIAYLTVGYPSLDATLEIVPALADWGCDMVELGIPFSDPLADGATIQKSSHLALQSGVTPEQCLDVASKLRHRVDIPLLFMTYYNPVFSLGVDAFCRASVRAGIDGLIIPDLPPEEGSEIERQASSVGIDLVYLLAPTSSDERIELVAERSRGFIYVVSLVGVTGARATLPDGLEAFVASVRKRTSTPLAVGFGVSTPEQAARVASIADGVIVGSRLIQLIECLPSPEPGKFVRDLRRALDASEPPG